MLKRFKLVRFQSSPLPGACVNEKRAAAREQSGPGIADWGIRVSIPASCPSPFWRRVAQVEVGWVSPPAVPQGDWASHTELEAAGDWAWPQAAEPAFRLAAVLQGDWASHTELEAAGDWAWPQ